MIDEVKQLLESDPNYKRLLKMVLENPYIERQALAEKASLSSDDLERMLGPLQEKMVVLELASQADSSLESRVPKKIYLVNPEIEGDLRA
ncbi:MAG: hypothetical protein ACE5KR_04070, partial [Candidatus Bipolaricaulia bacterium]